jgi:hypothetical protein
MFLNADAVKQKWQLQVACMSQQISHATQLNPEDGGGDMFPWSISIHVQDDSASPVDQSMNFFG